MLLLSENAATAKGQMCFKGAVVDPWTVPIIRCSLGCFVAWGFKVAIAVVSCENYSLIGVRSS